MSDKSSSSTSSGIGFAGLLTIVFIILKLNPGADPATGLGPVTTRIVEWPWFEWWGWCVFCPILWSFYMIIGTLGAVAGLFLLGLGVKAILER